MPNHTITAPAGFRAAAVAAGIKSAGALDVGLIVADAPATAAAVFTTNKIVGPAVTVSRDHVRSGRAQAIFVNAGNANVCTGARGRRDVQTICRAVARSTGVAPLDVLVCSTGVIGHFLPMDCVRAGIAQAADRLGRSAAAGRQLAQAILTTDTRTKMSWQQVRLGGQTVHLAGVAKGSGMIAPNMATMLAFVTTDVDISAALLRRALRQAVAVTFNKVSVDNHQSTSDTAILLASGAAQNRRIRQPGADFRRFAQALWVICDDLARQIAADGEGATHAVTLHVTGAATRADAARALRAVVGSPLVRTAFYGADPNWGRIVSAVGYSGARFDPAGLTCKIAGVVVYRRGRPVRCDAARLSRKMKTSCWTVEIDLGLGRCSDFCYTCDLTHGYVTINAEYHT